MLKLELRGGEKMLRDLETARKRAIPYAARDAVNSAAFAGRRVWGDQIRKSFVTRNTFTAGRALQVDKAKGTDVRRMEAILGSTADYMPRQEFGATVRGRGGHKGIPGPAAAGQAAGSMRTRPVRHVNRITAIRAARAAKGATRQQRNVVAIAIAKRKGMKFAVLERPGGGRGVFGIGGGKRKTTTRLFWDISRASVRIQREPTLGPTLERLSPWMLGFQHQAVLKQLKFHRVCGY